MHFLDWLLGETLGGFAESCGCGGTLGIVCLAATHGRLRAELAGYEGTNCTLRLLGLGG